MRVNTQKNNVMKALFILLFSAASLFAKSAPTGDGVVSPQALETFKNSFSHAQEVYWSESADFYKAEFVLAGQYLYAFFSKEEGSLLAVTKNIAFTDLPVLLQTGLRENYCNYWISEIMEVSGTEGVTYYLTLENADRKMVLHSVKNNWTLYQKKSK